MLSGKDIADFFAHLHEEPPLVLKYDDVLLSTTRPEDFYSHLTYCPLVILYPGYDIEEGFTPCEGHWVCLFTDHNKDVNFFDSFGRLPDTMYMDYDAEGDQYYGLPMRARRHYKQLVRYLWLLNKRLGVDVEYNDAPLQTCKNTCGKWVCLRLLLKDYTADEFVAKVKKVFSSPQTSTITKAYDLLMSRR